MFGTKRLRTVIAVAAARRRMFGKGRLRTFIAVAAARRRMLTSYARQKTARVFAFQARGS